MSAAHPSAPAGMPLARLDEGYPVLAALSPSGRRRLLEAARWMRVPGGTCLFDEHQACEGFPFVVDGSIRVAKSAPNGRELPLYRVGSGRDLHPLDLLPARPRGLPGPWRHRE